ncbi:DUF2252 family protein [Mucilaginibacter sp. OK098]|uniref:DUF2252 family protein n=1 Tax=Mucilaginibacter sp. OK098 TaxID=1855297 RepID=UPI0009339E31|nr:DUF2252 family protein [Mucilaginibacter sp. OK098]
MSATAKLFELLKLFNDHLLPEIDMLKYDEMAENVFRYYRGTCHLFYEDLSAGKKFPALPITWI